MTAHKLKQQQCRQTTAAKHEMQAANRIGKHGTFTAAMADEARLDATDKEQRKRNKLKGPR